MKAEIIVYNDSTLGLDMSSENSADERNLLQISKMLKEKSKLRLRHLPNEDKYTLLRFSIELE